MEPLLTQEQMSLVTAKTRLSVEMIAEVGISERGHQLHKGGGDLDSIETPEFR